MINKTIVECECISKKQVKNYDPKRPLSHVIELQVPYDQNSIFWAMSGGTNINLNTVNQEAAEMFVIGQKYMIDIYPKPVEVKEGDKAISV
jgi:hypothetical protein